jgi:hypothetical protein
MLGYLFGGLGALQLFFVRVAVVSLQASLQCLTASC